MFRQEVAVIGSVAKTRDEDSDTPKSEPGELRIERWTAVSTATSSAHHMAWTGDMPTLPQNSESDYLSAILKSATRVAAWPGR